MPKHGYKYQEPRCRGRAGERLWITWDSTGEDLMGRGQVGERWEVGTKEGVLGAELVSRPTGGRGTDYSLQRAPTSFIARYTARPRRAEAFPHPP